MKLTFRLMLVFAALSLVQLASAVTIGQIDDFQTGLDNWFAGGGPGGGIPPIPPHVVPNGGPLGVGDAFMEITASTLGGAGSKVVALNDTQWAGNYLGITGIAMDLKNLSTTDLTVRLQLENPIPGPPTDEAVTTFGAFLLAGTDWTRFFFPISTSSLTTIFGDVNNLLPGVTVLGIINAAGPTEADTELGVLGVDNIQAVPEPTTFVLVGGAVAGIAFLRRRRTAV